MWKVLTLTATLVIRSRWRFDEGNDFSAGNLDYGAPGDPRR